MSKSNNDNHANQCNPNNDAYWESRGEDERPDDWQELIDDDDDNCYSQHQLNDRSNQLNPNHGKADRENRGNQLNPNHSKTDRG